MKLKSLFTPRPKMMTYEEVKGAHDLLAAVVLGQTPLRFEKLKKGQENPLQMMAEVFAFILKLDHGRQVGAVLEDIRTKLAAGAATMKHKEEQDKIIQLIQQGYEAPADSPIIRPPNSNGVA